MGGDTAVKGVPPCAKPEWNVHPDDIDVASRAQSDATRAGLETPLARPTPTRVAGQDTPDDPPELDLARTIFSIVSMAGLIGACLWILRPFIPALIWSTMIVVATWSAMLALQRRLWNRRWLAVIVMTAALLLAFVIPFLLAIGTLVTNVDEIATWLRFVSKMQLPSLPRWIETLPVAGPKIASTWAQIATKWPEELTTRLDPYANSIVTWFVREIGSLGKLALQFLLTLLVSVILYIYGETAALGVRRFFRRLGGARGEEAVQLAAQAIRGVAFGVVVTALVQSVIGAIGLAAADVPFVSILGALMFVLAVAQIGAVPVLLCACAWL